MVETLVIVGIVCLLTSIIGTLIALRIQLIYLNRSQVHQQAWERAQEGHQRNWEEEQKKEAGTREATLNKQVQQIQKDWQMWQTQNQEYTRQLAKQYKEAETQLHVQYELARLPRIEDVPLTLNDNHQYTIPNWQPPMLQGIDLSNHDLSHRFIGQADLRNAQLTNTNFYMADLSGANLNGANLTGADLSGANLAGANLHDAKLTGANLLVADLHNAILTATDLRGARNLTREQINTAVCDDTTQLHSEVALSLTRQQISQQGRPGSSPETVVKEKPSHFMSSKVPGETKEADEVHTNTPRPEQNGKERAKST